MAVIVHHRATVTRSMDRFANCEKCGCQYTFGVTASARGRSHGEFGTPADAENAAVLKVRGKLLAEPAACPDCGWYQQPMVGELRRRHRGWMTTVAKGLLALAVGGTALFIVASGGYQPGSTPVGDVSFGVVLAVALAVAAVAGCLILLRSRLAQDYDPNRLWPQRPEPGPGEPQAKRTPEYERRLRIRDVGSRARGGLAALAWYFQTADGQFGPVSLAGLADQVNTGALRAEDLAWAEGLTEWVPVEDVLAAAGG